MTDKKDKILLKGRLNGKQRNKVKSLLDMMYTPLELSKEIGVTKNQVYRVYIPLGCPHGRDSIGHILINGKVFRDWVIDLYKRKQLKSSETYCVSCKQVVEIIDPEILSKGGAIYKLAKCPVCGSRVARIISSKRKKHDKQEKLEAH